MTSSPWIPLRAGPLRALFDPATGFVRRIRVGPHEILRGIYAAVRDRNWGTVPTRLRDLRSEIAAGSFCLSFSAECRQDGIVFDWQGELRGTEDGQLHYALDGQALTTFLRNRIGFCILHPLRECAGARARQRTIDGRTAECRFPDRIEPQIVGHASFRNLQAVAHEIAPGLWAEVQFAGEVFEMEDQRNWTDASFKTYCTPLALPFPVEIPAGTRIQQRVTLRLLGHPATPPRLPAEPAAPTPQPPIIGVPAAPSGPLPQVGLGMARHGQPLSDGEIASLRTLGLAHLRADVRLARPDWPATLEQAIHEATTLGTALELALHLPPQPSNALAQLRARLRESGTPLARILALRTGEPATTRSTLQACRDAFADSNTAIGAGTDAHFCELNREWALGHCAAAQADLLFWPVTPQVHAFDDLSIMETLEALPELVRTARTFARNPSLTISPVTLRPRFNAVALDDDTSRALDAPPAGMDPRQPSAFTAEWTLGVHTAFAACGVTSVTLFETTGACGVMEHPEGSRPSTRSTALPPLLFPVGHLLQLLAGFDRCAPLEIPSAAQSSITGLAVWSAKGQRRIVLANLTPTRQTVRLSNPGIPWVACAFDKESGRTAPPPTPLPLPPNETLLSLPANAFVTLDPAEPSQDIRSSPS